MSATDRPRLRPFLAVVEDESDDTRLVLRDRLGLTPHEEPLSPLEFLWLQLCDGERSLRDIQLEAMRHSGPTLVPLAVLQAFVERMERATFLDGPAFRALVSGPERAPVCVGSYEGDPTLLRRQLRRLFASADGPGLPRDVRPDGRLRAALLPHIDYGRGGTTYAWGFKEVVERTDASLFLVVGTSHHSGHRFTLTRKNFRTPLGVTPTDQDFVDRLERAYGPGLFDDEIGAHLPEWSIELEVVFLQYLYEQRRPIRLVPLLVGSFHDCVVDGVEPRRCDDIGRMIEALRRTLAETSEPVCTLVSGDLAHLGPYFEEGEVLTVALLTHSRAQDRRLMDAAGRADASAYFRVVAAEGDARRICGLSPTYTALEALRPSGGALLHYDQYVHPRREQSVSFASAAFYE